MNDKTVSTERQRAIKAIAVSFFQWWWNSPGTNTEDGFDEWASGPGAASLRAASIPTQPEEPIGYISEETVRHLKAHSGPMANSTYWHIYGGAKEGWNDVPVYLHSALTPASTNGGEVK